MVKSKISILISQVPEPSKEKRQTIFDKVDEMERNIESNLIDSSYDMEYITCLYRKLCKCKRLRPAFIILRKRLKDILSKHGKYNGSITALDTGDSEGYNLDNGYSSDDY